MAMIGSAPRSGGRPKQATPAERGVEFAAHQAKLKEEAAKRREEKSQQAVAAPRKSRGRRA